MISRTLPPPSPQQITRSGIHRATLLATLLSTLFSPLATAEYIYNKDNQNLDGSSLLVYEKPVNGETFTVNTEGFEPKDSLVGVEVDTTSSTEINVNEFIFTLGEPVGTFEAISAGDPFKKTTGLKAISNTLTVYGNHRSSFSTRLQLINANNIEAVDLASNKLYVHDLQAKLVTAVNSTRTSGTIQENELHIENSSIKTIKGVSGSTLSNASNHGLKISGNHTIVSDSSFNELIGAYMSGAYFSEDQVSANTLKIINPTIQAQNGGSKIIAQQIASFGGPADRSKTYADVSDGELLITGTMKVDSASGNIQGTEFGAGYSAVSGVRNNHLIFKDLVSEFSDSMNQWLTYGGYSSTKGDAVGNSVTFDNAQFRGGKFVYGGFAANGAAYANNIDIKNGSVVEGVFIGSFAGQKESNANITIENSTVIGTVSIFSGNIDNTAKGSGILTVRGQSDISQAVLLPYNLDRVSNTDKGLSGYTGDQEVSFVADGFSGTIKQLGSVEEGAAFDHVSLLQQTWDRQDAILTITDSAAFKRSSLANGSLSFVDGEAVAKGGTITLVESENRITYLDPSEAAEKDLISTAGTAMEYTGKVNFGDNEITYTIQEANSSSQTVLVGDSRLAAAAFVNQSTDLLDRVFHGFTLSREKYGLMTFATAEGTKSNYDLSNAIKINGWNFLAGLRSVTATDIGDLTSAVFVEYGEGNYRTSNSHLGLKFRTDGEMQYFGAGVAVRLMFPSELYVEGSLRAGELQSDLNRALMDAEGNHYDTDTTSLYAGMHLGAGLITNPIAEMELDCYVKYFFTYTDSDSFTIDSFNETYSFDNITSHRLRIGTRASWNRSNLTFMLGLAGEYEFDAESDMVAANAPAQTSDLGGFSAFAEAGMSIRPNITSPWQFDMQVRGWTGQRDAVAGMATVNYLF